MLGALDRAGRVLPVEAVVDTGFSGNLTLPAESIRQLGLPYIGNRAFELANGQQSRFEIYLAAVSWHGRERYVVTLQSDGEPLLGVQLLWGSRLTMDALPGGPLEIEEIAIGP